MVAGFARAGAQSERLASAGREQWNYIRSGAESSRDGRRCHRGAIKLLSLFQFHRWNRDEHEHEHERETIKDRFPDNRHLRAASSEESVKIDRLFMLSSC